MRDSRSVHVSGIRKSDTGCWARTLGAILDRAQSGDDAVVRRSELSCGDRVIVRTRNSVYSLCVLGDDTFAVSGGWFERHGSGSPALVAVNGCTYGGSVIRHDVVGGLGMFLEFGNNVLTTRIQDVRIVRRDEASGSGQSLPC